jgi:hypothetical protein
MPITCTIDHGRRFVSVAAHGPVTLDDVLGYFDKLVVENAMPYPKLFDATNAEPVISDEDLMVLAARVSAYSIYDPRGPVAMVGGSTETKNILRRFMNLGRAPRAAMMFSRVRDARLWLQSLETNGGK